MIFLFSDQHGWGEEEAGQAAASQEIWASHRRPHTEVTGDLQGEYIMIISLYHRRALLIQILINHIFQRADEFLSTPPKTDGGQNEG